MRLQQYLSAAAAAALIFSSSLASAYEAAVEKHEGNITYITGGIGERETEALRAERSKYDLRVINSGKEGEFLGEAHLVIRDAQKKEILNTSVGPLFYANLPDGKYVVEVENREEAKTEKQSVDVKSGKQATLRFVWKAADTTAK